jgi:MFS family permease
MLVAHLALAALPATLATFLAMRRGLRSVPLLLSVALAASGGTAMLAFWAFYVDPLIGQATAFVIVLGSVQGIVLCRPDRLDRGVLRELWQPAALWALGSAFILYFGFVHGGIDQPILTAGTRFSHPLPTDNEIPLFFANWYFDHGHNGTPPPFADWLSSDRPPLQTGYVLAQRPFGWDGDGTHYQVLGVVVQQLWIIGLWAVLCAARIRPFARSLAIFAALASDIAILHGFFVWPKLIAAALLLGALAIVLSDDWQRLRRNPYAAALFAALCALAMLAHGASAFGVIPLLIVGALRGMPSWRWFAIAALTGVALLGPWSAYQRFADPPGDRLLKWQLGGSLEIDDRGALTTIVDSYGEAGLGGTLENKWNNVNEIVGPRDTKEAVRAAIDETEEGHFGRAIMALRTPRFYSLLPLMGLLLLAPVAMAVARVRGRPDGPEWRFAVVSLAYCALVCVFWALLMFGGPDSSAMIHVGSMAVPLLAVCGCVIGAYSVYPRLAIALVALNALLVLALYAPALSPPPGTSYSVLSALIAGASLAGFALVAFRRAER